MGTDIHRRIFSQSPALRIGCPRRDERFEESRRTQASRFDISGILRDVITIELSRPAAREALRRIQYREPCNGGCGRIARFLPRVYPEVKE